MAPRPRLRDDRISSAALADMERYHQSTVREVSDAVEQHRVVVVGMKGNPHVRKARGLLDQAGIEHRYLEYGGYLSEWYRRLAIKLWSGWPTFPQVFVDGRLIGGRAGLEAALQSGELEAGTPRGSAGSP